MWRLVSFCAYSEETYAVVVDDLRDDGELSRERARFEEDNCSMESVIVSQESISTNDVPRPISTKRLKFDS
jgi:hypothetical protein